MIQFYFLSIFFNALTGYILITGASGDGDAGASLESDLGLSVHGETFRLILGILTMVTGLLKLLSSVQGDVPVIGDLIPALVGLFAGFILVFSFYRNRASLESEEAEKIEGFLLKNRKWVGFIAVAAAALHFMFPLVILL
jgi:hypothetical protein